MNKLYKIEKGKMLFGVCTGVSDFLRTDVNIIRLLVIITSCIGGIGAIAYIAAAFLLPFKPES